MLPATAISIARSLRQGEHQSTFKTHTVAMSLDSVLSLPLVLRLDVAV
ncbi:hypothetical protein [Amycolatopsis orientalis]|nr:hypothetical protein [Amycolatopsis orientalis]